ncbi:MAG: TrmH family RNA methyltransferase [Candidatus Bathyarchaeota archaeon]
MTPEEFASTVSGFKGQVALLFGRESTGLSNRELMKCDIIVTIPSSPEYKTLNVALASAIIFYELWKKRLTNRRGYSEEANREYRVRLLMVFSQMCKTINFPSHKERLATEALKNIISRAFISKRETTLLIGAFREILERA